jgi:hypothetical protein
MKPQATAVAVAMVVKRVFIFMMVGSVGGGGLKL